MQEVNDEHIAESYCCKISTRLFLFYFRKRPFLSPSFSDSLFLSRLHTQNRIISNSTYLRRLFIRSEMTHLFPYPGDGESTKGDSAAAASPAPASAAAADTFAEPATPPSAPSALPSSTSAAAALCAASLASLSASAAATFSRIQNTINERSIRARCAAPVQCPSEMQLEREGGGEGGGRSGGGGAVALDGRGAATSSFPRSSSSAAAAAAASPMAHYEAVPILDERGRAFCVIIEWLRSKTMTKAVVWKVGFFFVIFLFPPFFIFFLSEKKKPHSFSLPPPPHQHKKNASNTHAHTHSLTHPLKNETPGEAHERL